ncbi:sialin-like [Lineus longissimus]|uniref:sialin-like n=1 Tax=Lineus longissimus TaxID=88925 RepID=UPI00315D8224
MAWILMKRAEKRSKFVFLTWRYRISYIGFVGMLLMYCLRVNMSLAIVCMVKPVHHAQNATEVIANVTGATYIYNRTIVPVDRNCDDLTEKTGNDTHMGTFEWPRSLQGTVLAAYFYGYIITQVPSGLLARRFGSKIVIIIGLGIAAIGTILIPLAARWNVYCVLALRVVIGLGSAVTVPAYHNLWSQWAPVFERTKLATISIAGSTTGNIIMFFLSGFLCVYGFDGGWPSIFYLSGIGTLTWLVFWTVFVYDSPDKHPYISEEERREIHDSIDKQVKQAKNEGIPWLDFAKSPAVWAIIIGHLCNNYVAYTLMVCLPIYMRDVLKFDMKQNGLFMALPYVLMSVSVVFGGQIVDILRKRGLKTGLIRKICQTLGCMVPAVLLIGAGFVTCQQRMAAVALFIIAVGFTSFTKSAYVVNHLDIAPKYAGILYGISNTFGTISGFAAPLVVGKMTTHGSREEWQIIFYICAAIYTIGTIFYGVFAEGEVQPWAMGGEQRAYSISNPVLGSGSDQERQSLSKADSLEPADDRLVRSGTDLMRSLEEVDNASSDSEEAVVNC